MTTSDHEAAVSDVQSILWHIWDLSGAKWDIPSVSADVFPVSVPLEGYPQIFSGYGENLIDYSHYQNVLGIGLLPMPLQ